MIFSKNVFYGDVMINRQTYLFRKILLKLPYDAIIRSFVYYPINMTITTQKYKKLADSKVTTYS